MNAREFFEKQDEDVQIAILEIAWMQLDSVYYEYWARHFDLSDDVLAPLLDELDKFLNDK